jgi:carbonic anhydrase/acetyltransferase-like protein (isoleucine patch superfamily)
MPLYNLGDRFPVLAPTAYVAPSADLIGDVRVGERASIWFGAVIRADNTSIAVGADTNVQDGAICHSDSGFPLTIGARVTVGHQAILHGCAIEDDCLIGMGARILNGAVVEPECIIGAGSLITEGKRFSSGSLVIGAPARVVRQITDEERQLLRASAIHYAQKAARYATDLKAT